jgi:hypothetical protein
MYRGPRSEWRHLLDVDGPWLPSWRSPGDGPAQVAFEAMNDRRGKYVVPTKHRSPGLTRTLQYATLLV